MLLLPLFMMAVKAASFEFVDDDDDMSDDNNNNGAGDADADMDDNSEGKLSIMSYLYRR